ncbi:hypothetical protein [Streptomyces sp. NPDC048710]|uniref:hypothetical protein n=1 Tax=Streptomyces sp. NPDC048710 TaxID=3365586 RepID=UPI0037111AE5
MVRDRRGGDDQLPRLTVTSTSASLSAKYPYLSAGYDNTRAWNRTATAVAPNGTLRVAWPAADGVHVTPSYATPLTGASPTTTTLRIARLTP